MTLSRGIKNGLARIADLSAGGERRAGRRPGFRILLYHAVHALSAEDRLGLRVAPDDFRRQMEYLRDRGCRVMRLVDLVACLERATAIPENALAISFDDGYQDNAAAAQVLAGFRFPATIFLRADPGAGTAGGYWEKWKYLSPDELKQLAGTGLIDFGSHGFSHRRLCGLDDRTLAHELGASRERLQSLTGQKVELFSYPHGSADARVRQAVNQAGYRAACGSLNGINVPDTDRYALRRTEIDGRDGMQEAALKIRGAYDWLAVWQMLRGTG